MTIYSPRLAHEDRPRYLLLADAIERDIVAGELMPGQRLPTHRDLADELEMNVSTVTRGYGEAEKRGLIKGTVGRGTFVSADARACTSMVSFEPCEPGNLEMGLITPMHCFDPDVTEGFRRLARRRDVSNFMRYTDPRGLPEHRRAGADWAARYGVETSPDKVLVCAGSQHGLTCALGGLLRAGDRLATDQLTYPGLKTLAGMLGLRLTPVAMDDHGMIPASLDTACRTGRISAVYLMPGVQNPTTVTLPEPRRREIAHVCQKHDVLIVEDDAYGLTAGEFLPPVGSFAPERSVYIAGLSKSLGAGLRVAFICAPSPLLKPLAQAILNTVWMTPSLNAELAAMWINDGTADRVMQKRCAEAARRYMLACDVLEGLRFRGKRSGFFLWCNLPGPWTGASLQRAALERGINLFGADKFSVGEAPAPAAVRISLTGTDSVDELKKGLTTIREILDAGPKD